MGTVRIVPFDQVAPGDVAFDRARSSYGRLVELTTREDIAHCFVYHRRVGTEPDGGARWLIAEMSARFGAVLTERVEPPAVVLRVWRGAVERDRLLACSRDLVRASTAYDWTEIGRVLLALKSGRVLDRRRSDKSICVTHVHRAILAARPDLASVLPAIGAVLWPGRLVELLRGVAEIRSPAAEGIAVRLAAVARQDALVGATYAA